MFRRVIWIVIDSVGIGEAPDAEAFGDVGADTIGNIIKKRGYLHVPNMERLQELPFRKKTPYRSVHMEKQERSLWEKIQRPGIGK